MGIGPEDGDEQFVIATFIQKVDYVLVENSVFQPPSVDIFSQLLAFVKVFASDDSIEPPSLKRYVFVGEEFRSASDKNRLITRLF